ncbi:pilus assembly protein [Boseaceae bacterium BT-24-1]|nr:pilus assembly protein [Boseaceae bacterium BT-24-1]
MPGLFRSFLKDVRGVSALMFGLAAPATMLAVGGGIDYSQAAARRQRLASAVELACQHAGQEVGYRKSQTGANPNQDYKPVINELTTKKITDAAINGISGVAVSSTLMNDVITITATAASANAFAGVLGYASISVGAERNCNVVVASSSTPGKVLFSESFENNHNVASNSWTVLNNWNGWTTQSGKGGIEINGIPALAANTIRFGNFFAELDSHCYTSGCKTNSNMWREFGTNPQLEVGDYELSYWYISRERNPDYGSQTLCAYKTDANTVWDKLKAATWREQTNRIEVFFQKKSSSYTTPSKDVDKATDQVDVCVHTDKWTERKIPLKVTTKGTYRIFFQAAGREDTYGGLIDYIRFCSGICP